MAYFDLTTEDPEIYGSSPANAPGGAQGASAGTLSRGGSAGSFGGGATGGGAPTQSGSFTNIQGYLNANSGQGAGMVDKATQDTQNEYKNTTGAIDSSLNSYKNSLGQLNQAGSYGGNKDGFAAYGDYLQNTNNASAPNITGQNSAAVGQVQSAADAAKAGGSAWTSGLSANLGAQTGGNRALNSAIMGIDPSARARGNELQGQWSGIGGYLNNAQDKASNSANEYNRNLGNARSDYDSAKGQIAQIGPLSDSWSQTAKNIQSMMENDKTATPEQQAVRQESLNRARENVAQLEQARNSIYSSGRPTRLNLGNFSLSTTPRIISPLTRREDENKG